MSQEPGPRNQEFAGMVEASLHHIFDNGRYEEQFINRTILNVVALMQQTTNILQINYAQYSSK